MPKIVDGIITYPTNDGGHDPYVIWDIKEASIVQPRIDNDQARVVMFINQITCTVSKSFPTGEDNLTLVDAFGKYGRTYNGGSYDNASWQGGSRNVRRR